MLSAAGARHLESPPLHSPPTRLAHADLNDDPVTAMLRHTQGVVLAQRTILPIAVPNGQPFPLSCPTDNPSHHRLEFVPRCHSRRYRRTVHANRSRHLYANRMHQTRDAIRATRQDRDASERVSGDDDLLCILGVDGRQLLAATSVRQVSEALTAPLAALSDARTLRCPPIQTPSCTTCVPPKRQHAFRMGAS